MQISASLDMHAVGGPVTPATAALMHRSNKWQTTKAAHTYAHLQATL